MIGLRAPGIKPSSLIGPKRLALEWIVAVGVAAFQDDPERTKQVRRQEERAPPLTLPDVNPLVGARRLKQLRGARDDDMAERHGAGAAGKQREISQKERRKSAVNLKNAAVNSGAPTGQQRQRCNEEAQ